MSIKLMSKVFETDLQTSDKFVLLAMADYASDDGESIYSSIDTLARKTSLTDRTVQHCIANLIDKGWIALVENGGGRHNTNLYCINQEVFTYHPKKDENFRKPKGVIYATKGEIETIKGEIETIKGVATSPDPLLTINNPLVNQYTKVSEPIREECDPDGITESMGLGYGGIRKKKVKKEREAVHPAIAAYHTVTGKYPRKELYPQIVEVLGTDPDVVFMRECFVEWLKVSQNPSPWRWLFEWYKNGEIKKGFVSKIDNPLDVIKEWAEENE